MTNRQDFATITTCLLVALLGYTHLRVDLPKQFFRTVSHDGDNDTLALASLSSSSSFSSNHRSLTGCSPDKMVTKRIVVVGAGAAGLTASKRLHTSSLYSKSCLTTKVTILEATSRFGGRVGKDEDFTKAYPIDLGASWVYDDRRLSLIAQEPNTEQSLERNLVSLSLLDDFQGHRFDFYGNKEDFSFLSDNKLWSNFTWYDFFEQKVVSAMQSDQIVYDCPVDKIVQENERGQHVSVFCGDREYMADYVIVTASLAVLQNDFIDFRPPLPPWILGDRGPMWRGFKIFLQFSEHFYDDYYVHFSENGELELWDYSRVHVGYAGPNILAGYYMGDVHEKFEGMNETQVVEEVLYDLNGIFGAEVASNTYIRHKLVQWTDSPFVRGTYSMDYPPSERAGPQVLHGSKLLIAGEAFPLPPRHVGWVDGAALSGLHAAEIILQQSDPSVDWFSIPLSILRGDL
jgi:monoamine oxidase